MRLIRIQLPLISWILISIDLILLGYQLFRFYFNPPERKNWKTSLLILVLFFYNIAAGFWNSFWTQLSVNIPVVVLIAVLLIKERLVMLRTQSKVTVPPKKASEEVSAFTENCLQYNLSPREIQITQLLDHGLTYQQIADQLFISYHTVDSHMQNIYTKVGVRNKIAVLKKLRT
ncbi:MAG: LuxR C-terminal-related transcriptional regulator [Mucilaginibacter sp.]|uniref:response regulator transcription factor n=1 Tax=Mucilaginibacter sp. TaxID=1882438 RepID=UPI0032630FF6